MLEYGRSLLAEYSDHPILVLMFVIALGFAIVGVTLDVSGLTGPVIAGMFGVYTVFFTGIGLVGYLVVFLVKYGLSLRSRFAPHQR